MFFASYFILGLALIGLTPPFQSPDAFAHFDRAYGLARGDIMTSTAKGAPGDVFPVGVYQMEAIFSGMAAGPAARVSASEFSYGWHQLSSSPNYFTVYDTGGNAPFLYLPQVVGIEVGRLLSNHLLVGYYLAEVMNLLVFIALTRWAMSQLSRRLAIVLGLFLILPMVNSLAISVNPDCLLLALSTVFAASCFSRYTAVQGHFSSATQQSSRYRSSRSWNAWANHIDRVSYLSLLFMVIEKPPLVILGLLLPLSDRSLSFRSGLVRALVVLGSMTAGYEIWVRTATRSLRTTSSVGGIAPAHQVQLMFLNPSKDVNVLLQTLHVNGLLYGKEFIAGIGWLDTWFPSWFYQGVGALLLLSVLRIVSWRKSHIVRTTSGLVVVMVTALALLFTFYVVATSYSAPTIIGFQGRYLLPLLPSLLVVAGGHVEMTEIRSQPNEVARRYDVGYVLSGLQVVIFVIFVLTLLRRYWFR